MRSAEADAKKQMDVGLVRAPAQLISLNSESKRHAALTARAGGATRQTTVDSSQASWLRTVEQHRKHELSYVESSRLLSTYASLVLLSLNTLMFAANFLLLEPYKLRRIQSGIDDSSAMVMQRLGALTEAPGHLAPALQRQLDAFDERRAEAEAEADRRMELKLTQALAAPTTDRLNGTEQRRQLATLCAVACASGVVSSIMCVLLLGWRRN